MATFMGIALIILGICVLASPVMAGLVSVIIIGIFMAAAGIVECIHSFKETTAVSRMTWLVVGILTLICGLLVAAHPIFGLGFLTILLAIYFFVDGLVKVFSAFKRRSGRGWFAASGILSLILAYLIWVNWPFSGGWAIGILLGINFIFTGVLTLAVKDVVA